MNQNVSLLTQNVRACFLIGVQITTLGVLLVGKHTGLDDSSIKVLGNALHKHMFLAEQNTENGKSCVSYCESSKQVYTTEYTPKKVNMDVFDPIVLKMGIFCMQMTVKQLYLS